MFLLLIGVMVESTDIEIQNIMIYKYRRDDSLIEEVFELMELHFIVFLDIMNPTVSICQIRGKERVKQERKA